MPKRWLVIAAIALAAGAVAVWLFTRGGASSRPSSASSSGGRGDGGVVRTDRTSAAPRGGIDGVVLGADGAPVAGAMVRAASWSASGDGDDAADAPTAHTAADGRFALDVAVGRWSVTASAAGRVPADVTTDVIAGQRASIELRLGAGGAALRGQVTDATGGPVGGALVVLAPEQGVLSADDRRAVAASTGDDGRFEVGLLPGRWRATTTHPEYVRDLRSVDVAAGGTTLDIQLVPGGVIEGIVRDRATGEPVPRAEVSYAREVVAPGMLGGRGGSAQERERGDVTAGADGRFRITGLGAGRIVIAAETDDDRASDEPTEVPLGIAETATDVEVFVAGGLSIAGRVVTSDGAPVAGAAVSINGGDDREEVVSAADGTFRAGAIRPGRYRISARTEDTLPGEPVTVEVETTSITGVEVEVVTGAFVTGVVEPAGLAEVSEIKPEPEGVPFGPDGIKFELDGPSTRTAADGSFRLGPFVPGPIKLGARAADGKRGEVELEVPATGKSGVVITLEARGTIAGRVVSGGGKPVPGAVVSLRRQTPGSTRTMIVNGVDVGADRAATDGEGRFAVAGLDAGTWELTVLDELGAPMAFAKDPDAPVRVELKENQTRDGVELVVEAKDGVIRGVVLGPDGSPLADAWVTVHPEEVRLPGMGVLDGPGGGPRRPPPPDEPPAAPEDGGEPVAHSSMMITVIDSSGPQAGEIPPVLTGDDGRFEVRNLRRGKYRVSAEGEKGGARGTLGDVATGSDVTVKLQTLSVLRGTVTVGGEPVVDYSVEVDGPTRKSREVHDTGGAFSLRGLDAGDYTVEVRTAAGTGAATATIEAGKEATVTIAIQADGTVTGKVVDATGAPLANRMVIVGHRQAQGQMSISLDGEPPMTAADGSFTATAQAGPRTLFVLGPNGPDVHKDLDVVAGAKLDLGTLTADPPGQGP